MKRLSLMCVLMVLAANSLCFGRGMLIPKDTSLPPLAIRSHRVSVQIDSQLAVTKVEQVFENTTSRNLEATYIFPLPPGAAVNDFAMYINGKRVSGELVEKEKARQVYTDIVRRMRDPGLLEYMGGNLLKLNVFPIPANGRQKLEVQYSEVLGRDSSMSKYVYPLKTDEPASRTLEDFTLSLHLVSKDALTNIYSPSHKIGVTMQGDHEATVGFEQDKALLDRDVVLYYTVSDQAFGINLMTHKPDKDKDGYFLLLVTPRTLFKESDILPRDVCFVLDTSGSMSDADKLPQAKGALKYCVNSLSGKDRFTVIAFSTAVNPMSTELLAADAEGKKKAEEFIARQEPNGGTAIHSALAKALEVRPKGADARPYIVVFLTDGRPTVGEDDTDAIVKSVSQGDKTVRIFTWGVGQDVNTHLLDRIAEETRAVSAYVEPKENIEQKVSLFFNKLSKPVMANPVIDWGKMKVQDVYPQQLPDLFAGQQVTIFGRYAGSGDAAVTLTGAVAGRQETQTFEGTFGAETGNAFVEKLWAARHVGFLLDEIRLHGEKTELKEEVIRLSRTYGIQTPYTSYLVLESREEYARRGIDGPLPLKSDSSRANAPVPSTARPTAPSPAPAGGEFQRDMEEGMRRRVSSAPRSEGDSAGSQSGPEKRAASQAGQTGSPADEKLREVSGKDAIDLATKIREMKDTNTAGSGAREALAARRVGERTFYYYRGFWVDAAFDEKVQTLKVKYLSDAYFQVVDAVPALREALALGERVIVVVNGTALMIADDGKEKLTDEELAKLSKR